MINKYNRIDFYVDCLVVEAALSDRNIVKEAEGSVISSLIDGVKNYFGQHMSSDSTVANFLGLVAPYGVFKIFSAMGFKWFPWLAGFLTSMYGADITKLIASIVDSISQILKGGEKPSSEQVKSIVNSSVDSFDLKPKESSEAPPAATPAPAPAPAPAKPRAPAKPAAPTSTLDSIEDSLSFPSLANVNIEIRKAQFCKLELRGFKENYENNFVKTAASLSPSQAMSLVPRFKEVLKNIFSWFFIAALGSVGFLVAGDALNSMFGRPNAFSGTLSKQPGAPGKETGVSGMLGSILSPTPAAAAPRLPTATQKKFPVKSSYSEENYKPDDIWSISAPVDESSIKNIVVQFAKDVYDKLDNKDPLIRSAKGFDEVVNIIYRNNFRRIGSTSLIIPTNVFSSKKQIVDVFIDDVAAKSK